MLTTYLATLTKVSNTMNELVEKQIASAERPAKSQRGLGFFA
jgi:hypothetical protein